MSYTESKRAAEPFREAYEKGLEAFVLERKQSFDQLREQRNMGLFDEPERYREELRQMLGFPINEKRSVPKCLCCKKIGEKYGCNLFRMQLEVLPGVPFYGIYFQQKQGGKHPLIISQHGGIGTPELCSGLYETGSSNYYDMTERLLKYQVNVFAPQLLLWQDEDENGSNRISQKRIRMDVMLKDTYSSISALEVYAIMNSIDYFCVQSEVDADRIGMVGMSYGGKFTMLTTALDTRICAAISCSFFGVFDSVPGQDWNWYGSSAKLKDAEIAALCWPRDMTLLMGDKDPLFGSDVAEKACQKLKKIAGALPLEEHIRYRSFEGLHEFCQEDCYIEHMMKVLGANHQ